MKPGHGEGGRGGEVRARPGCGREAGAWGVTGRRGAPGTPVTGRASHDGGRRQRGLEDPGFLGQPARDHGLGVQPPAVEPDAP